MKRKSYNLEAWVPHLFLFYQEKVFRKLVPIMSVIALYAIIIVYADRSSMRFEKITNSNLSQFHLIFSFILTIIINFRVNTSYGRWWEARILWGGIVNNCRNLGLKFDVFVGLSEQKEFQQLLHHLPLIIKANLRKDDRELKTYFKDLHMDATPSYPVLFIIKRLYTIINHLRDTQTIRWEQYKVLDIHIANLMDLVGSCERIANTPVPPAYAIFVKQTLLFYSILFPFGWVDTFGFLIVPIMMMIVYILLGLEILSEELEEPFETDENGLLLNSISKNIGNNIDFIAEK